VTDTPTEFEAALAQLPDRHRDDVLAAFAALEHGSHPVHESLLPALRDATLRAALQDLLHRLGRTLVATAPHTWTSGYRDDVAAELTRDGRNPLGVVDRAVLVLVLIGSVAIPRSLGLLERDGWTSSHPTAIDEITRYSQLPRTEVRAALARLRAAGLVQLVPERGRGPGQGAAYLPGSQLHRLTPAARRRLQEDLVLAAGPDTPLAAAVRARRRRTDPPRRDQGTQLDQGIRARPVDTRSPHPKHQFLDQAGFLDHGEVLDHGETGGGTAQ
jgi:DNA-binding transcriptional ArsR family regulator